MPTQSLLSKILLAVSILSLPFFSLASLPTEINGHPTPSLAPMLDKVTPAVVNILVEKAAPAKIAPSDNASPEGGSPAVPLPPNAIAVGSGVILDAANGYIITNAHVIKDERLIVVTLKDGRRFHARLVGKDDGFDLAILQIHASHLAVMNLGNSDQLKVGDFVVAIGSPFGLTQTVTSGVISALNRSEPPIEGFQSFIQTDASINPGNSGGALVDMQGNLIGINTAIVSPTVGNIGIGFAIPSNMVKAASMQLIQHGKIARGMLGVFAQNITPELARVLGLKQDNGVIVTRIVADSPAEHAGIKDGDIILSLNNSTINSSEQLHNMLGLLMPGTDLQVKLLRDHHTKILSAKVGDPKALLRQREIPYLSGMSLQNFTGLEADSTLLKGALVVNVDDTSDGALAGLQVGDVITTANNKPVTSVQELMDAALASANKQQLLLKVSRENGVVYIVVQQDG